MVRAVVAAVVAAVLVAGCTAEESLTKRQYELALDRAGDRLTSALTRLYSSDQVRDPGSIDEAAAVLQRAADEIRAVAEELASLPEPDSATVAHDRLVRGYRELADGLAELAALAEEGDRPGLRSLVGHDALPGRDLVLSALRELRAMGYRVDA